MSVASWWAHKDTADGFRKAERWDSSNPDYAVGLGRALMSEEMEGDQRGSVLAFERAVALGPMRAENWASLGEARASAADPLVATLAFRRALDLFPKSPAINWEFANFLIRRGELEGASIPLALALAGDPALREGVFDLAWRAGMMPAKILKILPGQPETASAYLDYLVSTGRLDAAGAVWRGLVESSYPIDLGAAFRYFDGLLAARQADLMVGVWTDLARHERMRMPLPPTGEERIIDGGFEQAPLGGGFDWRMVPVDGAAMSFDPSMAHGGERSLAIRFDGQHNLDFTHVTQYVPVMSDTAYRFAAYARTEEITSDSGLRIAVYDAFDRQALSLETPNLAGTSGWQQQQLAFRTGPETKILIVQVVRHPSRKLDNRISGTVWLDDFSLVPMALANH